MPPTVRVTISGSCLIEEINGTTIGVRMLRAEATKAEPEHVPSLSASLEALPRESSLHAQVIESPSGTLFAKITLGGICRLEFPGGESRAPSKIAKLAKLENVISGAEPGDFPADPSDRYACLLLLPEGRGKLLSDRSIGRFPVGKGGQRVEVHDQAVWTCQGAHETPINLWIGEVCYQLTAPSRAPLELAFSNLPTRTNLAESSGFHHLGMFRRVFGGTIAANVGQHDHAHDPVASDQSFPTIGGGSCPPLWRG